MLNAFAGGSLFGARHGTGTPQVLALHGWRRTHRDWDPVISGLDAIALDLPGFGATPAPPEPWGLDGYAEAVAPVLDEMADEVVLIGHSFGGSVAVEMATGQYGHRIAGVVLTGAPLIRPQADGTKPPASFRMARWLHHRRLFPEARMERLRLDRGSADYRAATGIMRDTFVKVVNQDVAHRLAELTVPTSLVWGSDDTAAPLGMVEEAHRRIPHSTLVVLPGVGHDVPAEAPSELTGAITALLERQTRLS